MSGRSRSRSPSLFASALLACMVFELDSVAAAEESAIVFLSWAPDRISTELAASPSQMVDVWLHVSGGEGLKGIDARLHWTPGASGEPPGIRALRAHPLTSNPNRPCVDGGFAGEVLVLSGPSDSTWRCAVTSSKPSSCAQSPFIRFEFQLPAETGQSGQLRIASCEMLDEAGRTLIIPIGNHLTIHGGTIAPAPIVASWYPGIVRGTFPLVTVRAWGLGPGSALSIERADRVIGGQPAQADSGSLAARFELAPTDTGAWGIFVHAPDQISAKAARPIWVMAPLPEPPASERWMLPEVRVLFNERGPRNTGPDAVSVDVLGLEPVLKGLLGELGARTLTCAWPEPYPQVKPEQEKLLAKGLTDFGRLFTVRFDTADLAERAVARLNSSEYVRQAWIAWGASGGHGIGGICEPCTGNPVPYDFDIGQFDVISNDPMMSESHELYQWHLRQSGSFLGTYGRENEDIQTTWAWQKGDTARAHRGLIIGLLDSGIDPNHPDLQHAYSNPAWGQRVLQGRNFVTESGSVCGTYAAFNHPDSLSDTHGHGTAMAGLAAAITFNGVTHPEGFTDGAASPAGGWAGDQPDSVGCRVLPVKILNCESHIVIPAYAIGDAINWAAGNGARVLNMSWVIAPDPIDDLDPSIHLALWNALLLGAVSIAGTGNDNEDFVRYPAGYSTYGLVTAVGGTEYCGVRWTVDYPHMACDLGANQGSNFGLHVDVVAPAHDLNTTRRTVESPGVRSYYGRIDGTSGSTALVSGVAAALLSARAELRDNDIRSILRETAEPTGEGVYYTGRGRINHARALDAVRGPGRVVMTGTATGPAVITSQGAPFNLTLKGFRADAPGYCGGPTCTYLAARHEVKFRVEWPQVVESGSVPISWTRRAGTLGWESADAADAFIRFGYPSAEVVPGSVTASGCSLLTYTYFVPGYPGGARWLPAPPESLRIEWAASARVVSTVGVPTTDDAAPQPNLVMLNTRNPSRSPVECLLFSKQLEPCIVDVLDVRGRRVAVLHDGLVGPEGTRVSWNRISGASLAGPGVYFVRAATKSAVTTRSIVLLPVGMR